MHSRLPRRKRRWTACTSELPKQCARFSRLTQSIMDRFVRAFCPETSGHTQLFPWPWSDEFHVGALQGDAGVTTSGYTGARSFCPSSWTPFAVVLLSSIYSSHHTGEGEFHCQHETVPSTPTDKEMPVRPGEEKLHGCFFTWLD